MRQSDSATRLSRRTALGVLALAVGWLLTRGLVVWLFRGRHAWVTGDLSYFDLSLEQLADAGLGSTLVEYPLPGLVVIALPWLFAHAVGAPGAYAESMLLVSLVADAAFTVLLARVAGPRAPAAVVVWVLAVPLLGATAYARFDLLPGLLAGVGLLLLATRPGIAAAAAALATGLKLWPALVLPALAAPARSRRRVVGVTAVTGALLAGASLLAAGWDRLVSPLTWQAERGLQIESVAATPAMVGWALEPDRYTVAFTEYHAFEVGGPGTAALTTASEIVSLAAVPALVALWVAAWRRGRDLTTEAVVWAALAAVSVFVVTSKVLSPQYLLWLLPLVAAGTAVSGSRSLRAWAAVLLVATALTQAVFPELYADLVEVGGRSDEVVLLLVVRNALLVVLTAWAGAEAVRTVRRTVVSAEGRSPASRPAPRGTSSAPSGGGQTTRRPRWAPRWALRLRRRPGAPRSAPRPPRASPRP